MDAEMDANLASTSFGKTIKEIYSVKTPLLFFLIIYAFTIPKDGLHWIREEA